MRRLRRILLDAATALSLILLVAAAVLWARQTQALLISRPSAHALLQSDGTFWYVRMRFDEWVAVPGAVVLQEDDISTYYANVAAACVRPPKPKDVGRTWLGLAFDRGQWTFAAAWLNRVVQEPVHVTHVGVPRRLAVASTAFLPALRLLIAGARFIGRRRRRGAAHCPNCGYDCRATPDRCPECGRDVASTAHLARPPDTGG